MARESLKLADLSKVKLWVEMLPNVVLPALLEVEDGAWTFIVTVSVTEEVDEDDIVTSESTRSRDELLKAGGCVSQWSKNAEGLHGSIRDNECYSRRLLLRSHYRCSSTELATKRENGWEGSSLGPTEEIFNGPTALEPLFKAQPVRAQRGSKNRGLHAGPVDPQVHETVALSSPTLQRDGSSAKAVTVLARSQGPVEVRAGVEAFSGEDGWAFELKAQSLSNPSLPSDAIVGYNLKGPSRLGQSLGGMMSSGKKGRSRREEDDAARKGKAPVDQTRGSTQKEEMIVSKKMWTTLFLLSVDRQQRHRSSSEPLFLKKSSSFREVRNLEEDFGTGSLMERGLRENPLFRCLLSRNKKRRSREGTSTSRGEVDPRNPHFEEDKEGFLG